jgi:hypothetical protein
MHFLVFSIFLERSSGNHNVVNSDEGGDIKRILEITPGPGEHDVAASLSKRFWSKEVSAGFRSGTSRFKDHDILDDMTPAPSKHYILILFMNEFL